MKIKDRLFIALQYILPQHFLSRLMLRLTRCKCRWLLKVMLPLFVRLFKVNMAEAKQSELDSFASFNEFFTRELKPEVRPIAGDANSVVSPVDGAISQLGRINDDLIFQAKGHHYSMAELVGGSFEMAAHFKDGRFATIYLSPRDYHRIHMPVSGTLREMVHVPGKLFSVNPVTTDNVPALFARNERVVCLFETEFGPMAMILVGAIFVASIETVWHGVVTPPAGKQIRSWSYTDNTIQLAKAAEMGRFNMGSTVILLFPNQTIEWDSQLQADQKVQLGQLLASAE